MAEKKEFNEFAGRESWGSKLGVILAVAGSAVGLGNFLRFPGVAVQNGGGAFMIPYFLSFVLLGIPICWAEWIMGRRAGRLSGLSSSPGIFGILCGNSRIRYVGALGLFVPIVIFMYYVYVESWCLAYAWFSISGALNLKESAVDNAYAVFFQEFTYSSDEPVAYFFTGLTVTYGFFLFTFLANFYLVYRGLSKGIEYFCRIAMPLLVIMAVIVVLRVVTLGTPNPAHPEQNVVNGLGFMWNPHWEQLKDPAVWIAACGQIFFSLSVGFGIIVTYASYLTKKDDVVLSGLTASATNEFCEVCLGGLMVIPAALIFLGTAQMAAVAEEGTFGLGFVVMPHIFDMMPGGVIFGACFYVLLFLAGITSSLSMLQPAIAFFEEGFGLNRRASVTILGLITFLGANAIIISHGLTVMDTVDTYTSNIGIPLLALFEVFVFIFMLKVSNGVKEASYGADMPLPKVFGFVITYITPLFLFALLGWWFYDAPGKPLREAKQAIVEVLPSDIAMDMDSIRRFEDLKTQLAGVLKQPMPPETLAKLQDQYDAVEKTIKNAPLQNITIFCMIVFFFMLILLQSLAWPRMQRQYRAYKKITVEQEE
ncbi:MAG: sodium-dependent transporter [Candidatus Omnitrophota bacterium]